MATVNQLISTISEWTGASEVDLTHRARVLREDRLLPTGKYGGGKGAAHVTAKHCAYFLLSFLARASEISTATAGAQAVKRFGAFKELNALKKLGAIKGNALTIQDIPDDIAVPEGYDRFLELAPAGSFLKALQAIIEGRRHYYDTYGIIKGAGLTTKCSITTGWIEISDGKTVRRHQYGFSQDAFLAHDNFVIEARISGTVFLKISELLGIVWPNADTDKESETARPDGTSEPYSKAKALTGADNTDALRSKHLDGTPEKKREQRVSASPSFRRRKVKKSSGGRRTCNSPPQNSGSPMRADN